MWWNVGPHLKRRMAHERGESTKKRESYTYFAADSAKEDFLEILRRKYGTLTRAWRIALDTDDSGLLDAREFASAMEVIGYVGNVRTLWFNLDEDQSGYISLAELDPDAAEALEKFRARCTRRFGSMDVAWEDCLDKDGSGALTLIELEEASRELGYDDMDEVAELFGLLRLQPAAFRVPAHEVLFLQVWEERKQKTLSRQWRIGARWVNKDPYFMKDPPNLPSSWKPRKSALPTPSRASTPNPQSARNPSHPSQPSRASSPGFRHPSHPSQRQSSPGPPSDFRSATPVDFRAGTPVDFRAGTPTDFRAGTPTDFRAGTPTDFRAGTPTDFPDYLAGADLRPEVRIVTPTSFRTASPPRSTPSPNPQPSAPPSRPVSRLSKFKRPMSGLVQAEPPVQVDHDHGDDDSSTAEYSDIVAIDKEKAWAAFEKFLLTSFGSLPRAFDIMDASGDGSIDREEWMSVVTRRLRYCRASEAFRLFDSKASSGARILYQDLGITPQEWIVYMHGKKQEEQAHKNRAVQMKPPAFGGEGKRRQIAMHEHETRMKVKPKKPPEAFWTCLPNGWGHPPSYIRKPPKAGAGPASARYMPSRGPSKASETFEAWAESSQPLSAR